MTLIGMHISKTWPQRLIEPWALYIEIVQLNIKAWVWSLGQYQQGRSCSAHWVTSDYWSYSSVTQTVNSIRTETRRWASHYIQQNCTWSCWDTLANLHSVPRQDDADYASNAFHTDTNYYKYSFFPLTIVQWNNLPSQALLSDDMSLYRSTNCSLNHTMS